jgi:two-component system sensor histidine kinase BaeS
VFDRFVRGDAARGSGSGSGLGLSICREIVEAHGGQLSLHPRDGGGLVVRCWLPPAPASAM